MTKTSVVSLLAVTFLFVCLLSPVSAVVVFRNTTGTWNLDYNNTGLTDKTFRFGTTGDIPIIGDWNNDDKDEIGVIRNNNTWILDASGNGAFGDDDFYYSFGKTGDFPVNGFWNFAG